MTILADMALMIGEGEALLPADSAIIVRDLTQSLTGWDVVAEQVDPATMMPPEQGQESPEEGIPTSEGMQQEQKALHKGIKAKRVIRQYPSEGGSTVEVVDGRNRRVRQPGPNPYIFANHNRASSGVTELREHYEGEGHQVDVRNKKGIKANRFVARPMDKVEMTLARDRDNRTGRVHVVGEDYLHESFNEDGTRDDTYLGLNNLPADVASILAEDDAEDNLGDFVDETNKRKPGDYVEPSKRLKSLRKKWGVKASSRINTAIHDDMNNRSRQLATEIYRGPNFDYSEGNNNNEHANEWYPLIEGNINEVVLNERGEPEPRNPDEKGLPWKYVKARIPQIGDHTQSREATNNGYPSGGVIENIGEGGEVVIRYNNGMLYTYNQNNQAMDDLEDPKTGATYNEYP